MWWASTPGRASHPNPEAPRCLPCEFDDSKFDHSLKPFNAPKGCPCTAQLICEADERGIFNQYCDVPKAPMSTYSMHGGAGGIISVGMLRAVSLDYMEKCVKSLYSTGICFCANLQCCLSVLLTERCITVCLTKPRVRAAAAVGCQSLCAVYADASNVLCMKPTELESACVAWPAAVADSLCMIASLMMTVHDVITAATGGDAFISICTWQAGYAMTDPGYSFFHPDVNMFDPGPEDRMGNMMKLVRALDHRCDDVCQVSFLAKSSCQNFDALPNQPFSQRTVSC